jgi:hypothetical protein
MKLLSKVLLLITALFLVVAGFLAYKFFWDPENTKQVFYPITRHEKGLLLSGDVILRRGYGLFSDGIVRVQNSKYPVSHCAMILADSSKIRVMHSLSSSVSPIDGAQFQSLQRFLNESVPGTVLVVRFKSSRDTIQQIVDRVKYYSNLHVPFDHEFDRSDTSKYYCTELFQHCFKSVLKRDIFSGQLDSNSTGVYNLTTFLDTSLFEVIINHHDKALKN